MEEPFVYFDVLSIHSELDPQYPIDRFTMPESTSQEERQAAIRDLAHLPNIIRRLVEGLSETQLETPYRPAGWTIRQVVHHLADSHMNAIIRVKLALTENCPTVKSYEEARWAELADSKSLPIGASLSLLDGVHQRFVYLWQHLSQEDFARTFLHPETGLVRLDQQLALYAWHGRHHLTHIAIARMRATEPAE